MCPNLSSEYLINDISSKDIYRCFLRKISTKQNNFKYDLSGWIIEICMRIHTETRKQHNCVYVHTIFLVMVSNDFAYPLFNACCRHHFAFLERREHSFFFSDENPLKTGGTAFRVYPNSTSKSRKAHMLFGRPTRCS